MMNMQLIINVNNAEELQSITNALNGIQTADLNNTKESASKPIVAKKATESKTEVKAVPTSEHAKTEKVTVPTATGAVQSLTIDDAAAAVSKALMANADNRPLVLEILHSLGVERMSGLKGDMIATFIKQVEAL